MATNPLITNNFIDSCAFDPKYDPEDKSATEILRLYRQGKIGLEIAHSTQKEIEHPNTPSWVKQEADNLIYTIEVGRNTNERDLLHKIEVILAGEGKIENITEDALHIFEAQKYGSYFITTDNRILKRKGTLHKVCSLKIMKPSEFLSLIKSHPKLKSKDSTY